MNFTKAQSLELFFIDGTPDGMLTAEVFNWTGHVLMTPRTQLSAALRRTEAHYTGVYLLLGEDVNGSMIYIGEGEDIGDRIKSHDTKKDWWTTAVLITSAANNLNKAHVKYLESRLVEEARRVGKTRLDNGNIPPRPSLSEASGSNMESFLEYILMVLPALRIDSFLAQTRPKVQPSKPVADNQASEAVIFEIHSSKHGIDATAILENGELVVQAGSNGRREWSKGSGNHTYGKLFAELVNASILVEKGDGRQFSENYAFKSPSAAAAMIYGRASNGTTDWKVKGSGKTYKEWEAEKLG